MSVLVVLLVLVAAPLRRSGAYTLPDFAESRLESRGVRRLSALLVVAIGWLYLMPQFQGAGTALASTTGTGPWLGGLLAFVMWLPNLVWQAQHDWPVVALGNDIADEYDLSTDEVETVLRVMARRAA